MSPGHVCWTHAGLLVVRPERTASGSTVFRAALWDPTRDVWKTLRTPTEPLCEYGQSAVWTGQELVLWGGTSGPTQSLSGGGARYHLDSDSWRPISSARAPSPRSFHTAVWTGEEMLVWGGRDRRHLADGAAWDPTRDTWRPIPSAGRGGARAWHQACWIGASMVVFGGVDARSRVAPRGGRGPLIYDHARARWTTGAEPPTTAVPSVVLPLDGRVFAWAGDHGVLRRPAPVPGEALLYDLSRDTWAVASRDGAPTGTVAPSLLWTGAEVVVWGGVEARTLARSSAGAAYDPVRDAWRALPDHCPIDGRLNAHAVWTGDEALFFGGALADPSASPELRDGARLRWSRPPPGSHAVTRG